MNKPSSGAISQSRDAVGTRRVSIVFPCFNESENIAELSQRLAKVTRALPGYLFSYIFIDNASIDETVAALKSADFDDKRVTIIRNTRNFGTTRSPMYGILQADGECVIQLSADLQEPPELIPELLAKWEEGNEIVFLRKMGTGEPYLPAAGRRLYYKLVSSLSEVPFEPQCTGFGLYGRRAVEYVRNLPDPHPFLRSMLLESGYRHTFVDYSQQNRARGQSKNPFLTLLDVGWIGLLTTSRVPLRLITLSGLFISVSSAIVALFYLGYKISNWETFAAGNAPVVIGVFFFGAVQMLLIGVVGEYVGLILEFLKRRPLVTESERICLPERLDVTPRRSEESSSE